MQTKFGTLLLASAGLMLCAPSPSPALPKNLGYTFYVNGRPVGRTDIRVSQSAEAIRFESHTRVVIGPNAVELTCRTEADPKTFAVRTFSYEGTKGGTPVATRVHVLGDSVYGFVTTAGERRDRARKLAYPRALVFEDWIVELQIVLAQTQAQSTHVSDTYALVSADSFLPKDLVMGYTGEVLVEAGPRSMTARKLAVSIAGGAPFESHIDPARGVPVYIRFPGVRAEMFLDELFGDSPVSYFAPE
jgi:hypothetical protein